MTGTSGERPRILESLTEPIVQAPMAGGPSTPELTAAVGRAGGFGFLAAGYRTADAVAADIAAVRSRTSAPFGVNLFVASPPAQRPDPLEPYLRELAGEAGHYGVPLGDPRHDDDGWADKLELVQAHRVAVVSFTFGAPEPEVFRRLRAAGIETWVTVSDPEDATRAVDAGADVLIVQGLEAGGHRGSFRDRPGGDGLGLLALLCLVRKLVDVPLVATGGIMTGEAVAAVLCAGASAAQIGTALLRTPEAATPPAQRAALSRPGTTALTRAFSGRLARGIVNRFQAEHTASAPARYPEVHHVTSPVRAEARRRGDADGFNLWAGQAFALGQDVGAADLVRRLGADARETLRRAADTHAGDA